MNLAIIPARGGSSRIPRKNIKHFKHMPMIGWSIETAHMSGLFDRVVVSTEDEEIAGVSMRFGAEVMSRPLILCEDDVGTQTVAQHVLEIEKIHYETYEYACVIYPCAPLLESHDLIGSLMKLNNMPQYDYCYSTYMDGRDAGAFYWGRPQAFLEEVPLQGHSIYYPLERAIDINTPEDWTKAEELFDERYD